MRFTGQSGSRTWSPWWNYKLCHNHNKLLLFFPGSWHFSRDALLQTRSKENLIKSFSLSDDRHRVQRLVFSLSLPRVREQDRCRGPDPARRKTSQPEFISFGRSYQKFVRKTPGSCFPVQSRHFGTIPGEILQLKSFRDLDIWSTVNEPHHYLQQQGAVVIQNKTDANIFKPIFEAEAKL